MRRGETRATVRMPDGRNGRSEKLRNVATSERTNERDDEARRERIFKTTLKTKRKRKTLFLAFSTRKGGTGKTTPTVLAASYPHYVLGYNVAVADCDRPQHSVAEMRERDAERVASDEHYKRMAHAQFSTLKKKAYPVEASKAIDAVGTAETLSADARRLGLHIFRPARHAERRRRGEDRRGDGLRVRARRRRPHHVGKHAAIRDADKRQPDRDRKKQRQGTAFGVEHG